MAGWQAIVEAGRKKYYQSRAKATEPKNRYIAEYIGNFFLVLTIGCTVIPGRR
jgi:hypothetical protein